MEQEFGEDELHDREGEGERKPRANSRGRRGCPPVTPAASAAALAGAARATP
jgi:hypothetical protein